MVAHSYTIAIPLFPQILELSGSTAMQSWKWNRRRAVVAGIFLGRDLGARDQFGGVATFAGRYQSHRTCTCTSQCCLYEINRKAKTRSQLPGISGRWQSYSRSGYLYIHPCSSSAGDDCWTSHCPTSTIAILTSYMFILVST